MNCNILCGRVAAAALIAVGVLFSVSADPVIGKTIDLTAAVRAASLEPTLTCVDCTTWKTETEDYPLSLSFDGKVFTEKGDEKSPDSGWQNRTLIARQRKDGATYFDTNHTVTVQYDFPDAFASGKPVYVSALRLWRGKGDYNDISRAPRHVRLYGSASAEGGWSLIVDADFKPWADVLYGKTNSGESRDVILDQTIYVPADKVASYRHYRIEFYVNYQREVASKRQSDKTIAMSTIALGFQEIALLGGTSDDFMLTWNGEADGAWTGATNWKTLAGAASDWVDGATAVFGPDGGTTVALDGAVTLGGLRADNSAARTVTGAAGSKLDFVTGAELLVGDRKQLFAVDTFLTNGVKVVVADQSICPRAWRKRLPRYPTWAYGGEWVTYWKNRTLSDLTILSSQMTSWSWYPENGGTAATTDGYRSLTHPFHPRQTKDGDLDVFQVQCQCVVSGVHVYVQVLNFRQVDDDVWVRCVVYALENCDVASLYSKDLLQAVSGHTATVDEGDDPLAGGVGVCDIEAAATLPSLEFRGALAVDGGVSTVERGVLGLTAANGVDFGAEGVAIPGRIEGDGSVWLAKSASGGRYNVINKVANTGGVVVKRRVVIDGTIYYLNGNSGKVKGYSIGGPGCAIDVLNGGKLYHYYWAHETLGGMEASKGGTWNEPWNLPILTVYTNSLYEQFSTTRTLDFVRVVLDGGRYNMLNADCSTHAGSLTIRNGGQFTWQDGSTVYDHSEKSICLGRRAAKPVLTSDGPVTNVIDAPIRMVTDSSVGARNADTQYLTIDTQTDLTLKDGLRMQPSHPDWNNLGPFRARKKGAAKLIFDFDTTTDYPDGERTPTFEFCVDEGRLVLNKSNAIVSTQKLSLYGEGEVEAAADTATSVGALTVGGTNTIEFAAGATLSCTGLTLNEGTRLELTNELSDTSFRVGTTKCLSAETLRRITINGRRAVQTDDGYVVRSGLMILVR